MGTSARRQGGKSRRSTLVTLFRKPLLRWKEPKAWRLRLMSPKATTAACGCSLGPAVFLAVLIAAVSRVKPGSILGDLPLWAAFLLAFGLTGGLMWALYLLWSHTPVEVMLTAKSIRRATGAGYQFLPYCQIDRCDLFPCVCELGENWVLCVMSKRGSRQLIALDPSIPADEVRSVLGSHGVTVTVIAEPVRLAADEVPSSPAASST